MENNILSTTKTAISNSILKAVFLSIIISILLAFNAKGQSLSDKKFSLQEVNISLGEILHILGTKDKFYV